MNDISKYNLYLNQMIKSIEEDRPPYSPIWLEKGVYKSLPFQGDIMWASGFYGIVLSLGYHKDKANRDKYLKLIKNFLNKVESQYINTKGVYLRDITESALDYYNKGHKEMSVSKDQILGLATALYSFVIYVNDTEVERISRNLLEQIYSDSGFFWFIGGEGYGNPAILFQEYQTLSKILTVNGWKFKFPLFFLVYKPIASLMFDFVLSNANKLVYRKHWTQAILSLGRKDEKGRYKTFMLPNFALNLLFFHCYNYATKSKCGAKKVIRVLNKKGAKATRHLNLAAVYLYACNKWGIAGKNYDYWKQVLDKDYYYFPEDIVPNSEWNSNWESGYAKNDFMCHTIHRTHTDENKLSIFPQNWSRSANTFGKTQTDLNNLEKKVRADNGLWFLVRYLLSEF